MPKYTKLLSIIIITQQLLLHEIGINMRSLCKIIRFRILSDILTDAEFNQFMTHFIKTCGREAILLCSSAFEQEDKENNSSFQHMESAINITKSIVRPRKNTAIIHLNLN